MINVLIVDDHEIIRRGLRQILIDEYPSAVIGEADNAEEAIKKLAEDEEWDVVICDFSMPGRSGLDMVQYIKKNYPKIPVLILSIHPEEKYAKRVLQAGAAGYLYKETASAELLIAINKALQGKKYISSRMAEKLVADLELNKSSVIYKHELLSDREFKVLLSIASGESITGISNRLFLSPNTISTYRARILAKMDMRTNADLVKYVLEMNLSE